jgi:GNAT superfamily N-acetyltransferase
VSFSLRAATPDDIPSLERLIASSARALGGNDYTSEQIEAALKGAWGVDSELIGDGTYFVAESDGVIVGCGGWGRRRTLFGGDCEGSRSSELLDPERDPARIRAFFVSPEWARRGIGAALLARSEAEARSYGFRSLELLATLPGWRLYHAYGYIGEERRTYDLGGGISIECIPMRKSLE